MREEIPKMYIEEEISDEEIIPIRDLKKDAALEIKQTNKVNDKLKEVMQAAKTVERKRNQLMKALDGFETKDRNLSAAIDPMKDKELAAMMPEKDKLRVYWRDFDGKLHPIQDYTKKDIEKEGNVVSFIAKHLRPTYGDFAYEVYMLKADGTEIPHSSVPSSKPKTSSDKDPSNAMLKTVLEYLDKSKPEQPQVDNFDNMLKFVQTVQGSSNTKNGFDIGQLLAIPLIKDIIRNLKDEPVAQNSGINQLLIQVADRLDKLEKEPQPQPILPMQPERHETNPADLMNAFADALSKLRPPEQPQPQVLEQPERIGIKEILEIVDRLKPQQPTEEKKPAFNFKDMLEYIPAATKIVDQLSGKEMLERQLADMKEELRHLRETPKQEVKERSPKDVLREFAELKELVYRIAGAPQEGSRMPESFWDFANNLLGNIPAIATSIGDLVSSVKRNELQNKIQQPARQLNNTGRRREIRQAQPQQEQIVEKELEIPEECENDIIELSKAENESDIIAACMGLLIKLANQEQWKKYISILLTRAQKGNKEGVMAWINGLINSLKESSSITEEVETRIMTTLNNHVDGIVTALATVKG